MDRSERWQRQMWRLVVVATIVVLVMGPALPAQAAPLADFDDLRSYAAQMKPLVERTINIAKEDAAILRQARNGNPDVLCDGELAANAEAIAGVRQEMATVVPPPEVSEIHQRLVTSLDDYGAGVGQVLTYCQSENRAQLARGLLKMAAARLKFGGAIIEFDLVLLQSGLEELMARYPGSDFDELVQYGQAVAPGYQDWAVLIAEEGPVVQAALDGRPEELCTTNITADAPQMQEIVDAFEVVVVPEAATGVHRLLAGGARAWLEGLNYSGEYCAAGQDWQRALYLGLALGGFDLGAAGFAGATAGYVAALEQAWHELW